MDKFTDIGNAERFVVQHGSDAKYCNKMRSWYLWNGRCWELDEKLHVLNLAVKTARSILVEAAEAKDIAESSKLTEWAKRSLQRGRLTNMLALAQSYLPITPDEFDANPWLYNVQNGTLDLKTGELLPHSQDNFISKVAPVEFNADAQCPLWEETVNTILAGDQDLIRYMQKVIGYSLTGDTKEKCFFVLHGSGDNGKTLFINAIMSVMGEYASSTTMETFIVTLPGASSSDVMRLKGARLAMASEAEKQFSLAEAKIKRLTGGDIYTACFKYKEPIDFRPEFKIFLLTNQIPGFNVTDTALMNRIHLVPFAVTIPKEQQDRDLLDKLKPEAPGVLNWAIRGCLLWQSEGLKPPSAVVAALGAHLLDVDVVARFVAECCVVEPTTKVGVTQLHNAYKLWASNNDFDVLGRKKFNDALSGHGYHKEGRSSQGVVWHGLTLGEQDVINDASV